MTLSCVVPQVHVGVRSLEDMTDGGSQMKTKLNWFQLLVQNLKKEVRKYIQYIEEGCEGWLRRQPPQLHHKGSHLKWMGKAVFSLLWQICNGGFSNK